MIVHLLFSVGGVVGGSVCMLLRLCVCVGRCVHVLVDVRVCWCMCVGGFSWC